MFDRDTLLTFKRLLDKCPDRIMDALDSLSANQFESKDWLVEKLNQYPHHYRYKTLDKKIDICLLASWYGLLAYRLIENFTLKKINNIDCIDYDPMAKTVAKTIWHQLHTENLKNSKLSYVKYMEQDIEKIEQLDYPVVICTSCEHLQQNTIYKTLSKLEKDTLVVLQSNNYTEVSQHVNCVATVEDFANQYVSKLRNIKHYEKDFGKYKRFMVIGTKI
tara:strand:+ start:348 stop:1004 length:657 start_codon:yes stop_codon:yes gene_type:complete